MKTWGRHCATWTLHNSGISEAAILSTCNRTELYCNTDNPQKALEWLAPVSQVKSRQHPALYVYLPQQDAVKHAFRVAAGLDSMVLGEPEILGSSSRLSGSPIMLARWHLAA